MVDRPLIQHVVDEAREAGIEHFIFVTGRNKDVIEDHFDRQIELETTLRERNKTAELAVLARAARAPATQLHAPAVAARARSRGMVRARACRRRAVRAAAARHAGEGQARLPRADDRRLSGLGEGANLIAVEEVPQDQTHMYGIVGMGKTKGAAFEITEMVEKPPRGKAPSNLIITGRYILQPEIFGILENQRAARAARSSSPTR